MLYRLSADAVLLLHLAFIAFVVFGAALALRWPWLAALHVPAAIWGFFVEVTGRICPLTYAENFLRASAGESGYAESFVEHYLLAVIYPAGLTRELQYGLAAGVVIVNLVIYGWVLARGGSFAHAGRRLAGYAWTAPNTLLGLLAGAIVVLLGGRARVVRGAFEFFGGAAARLAASLPIRIRFTALTLGHVILGVSDEALSISRDHEHIHIRQYEAWGPLFLFAYAGSSIWQLFRGRRAYRDNFFERQAFTADERSR